MDMSVEDFDLKFNRHMEKLNENARIINMCINGQDVPKDTEVFIPFRNKDSEYISVEEFLAIYDKPCDHRLELNTTNITINNGCIGIYDVHTLETSYISISPKDIAQAYMILNNTFNNNLLLVNTVKNLNSPDYAYVDGEYAIGEDRIIKLLKLVKCGNESKIQAPCAISASMATTLLQLNKAIVEYVTNAVMIK